MKNQFRGFSEARKFVHTLNLKNKNEWREYYNSGNKPEDIPSIPERVYKNDQWSGYGDFLGNGNIASFRREFRSFENARQFVRKLNLKSQRNWFNYCKSGKKPIDIPQKPSRTYSEEWKGCGDWLGTGTIANQDKTYWSFEKSRSFIQKLNLKSRDDFVNIVREGKLPKKIPNTPDHIYKKTKKWISWGDFLSTGTVSSLTKSRNYLNFNEARVEARKLAKKYNIKSWDDWINAHKEGKIPKHFPQRPDKIYGKKK